jgi:hypothetical protein
MDPSAFQATMLQDHTVTINILVAVGFSQKQMDAGLHTDLVQWLAADLNFVKLMTAAGLDARGTAATWLQRPEVIYGTLGSARNAQRTNKALAVGLAVPLGLCVLALGGIAVALAVRHKRRAAAAGKGGSSDGGGATAAAAAAAARGKASAAPSSGGGGGGAASRIPAKRRYIAPALAADGAANQNIEEMAAANLRAAGVAAAGPSTSGGGSGSALTAANLAAAAAAGSGDDTGSEADLRPRLRSVGDSVTSAARFEQEEVGEGAAGSEQGDIEDILSRAHHRVGDDRTISLVSRRTTGGGSATSAPWPGGVEAPAAGEGAEEAGPSVVMGAANPPRVGALASPFGNYNFGALAAAGEEVGSGGSGGPGSAGPSGGGISGGGGGQGSVGEMVISIAPDGSWVAPGLSASVALASGGASSGGGSAAGGSGGGAAAGGGGGGGGSGGSGGSGARGGRGSGGRRRK